jgi:predicted DNA-binding transcriptional regulator YafY
MESHFKAIERLYKMHELILQENTATPDEFARRMQISRRTLNKIIRDLNDSGTSIQYCRTRQTFYYAVKDNSDIAAIFRLCYSKILTSSEE